MIMTSAYPPHSYNAMLAARGDATMSEETVRNMRTGRYWAQSAYQGALYNYDEARASWLRCSPDTSGVMARRYDAAAATLAAARARLEAHMIEETR